MIHITQKDLSINKYWLEELAKQNEEIRWGKYNQEILSGCNTFIDFQIDYTILNNYIKENGLLEKAEELHEKAKNNNGCLLELIEGDDRFMLSPERLWVECKEEKGRTGWNNPYPTLTAKYLAYYKLGYYEPYQQYKERKEEEERKAKEEREKREEEAKKQQAIYNMQREKAKKLFKSNLEIIEVKEEKQEIKIYRWAHLNKNNRLREYKKLCNDDLDFYRQQGKTTHILNVKTYEALETLNNNLLMDIEQISGLGGTYKDDKEKYINLVIAVMFKNELQYVIDPQGYNYARYVGLV